MRIRRLEDRDVAYIHTQPGQFLGAHRSRLEIEEEVLKNLLSHYLIAENDTQYLGYVGFWLHEETAEIVTLYVFEDSRQKGVGKALMEAVFSDLVARGITSLTLEVSELNNEAIRLYERGGFQVVAKRRQYYQDGSDALLMLKEFSDENFSN